MSILIIRGRAYQEVLHLAGNAEIGGKSWVRSGGERATKLSEDQLVGLLGHMAASVKIFGTAAPFLEARREADLDPFTGDGGSDLPGNIDVKSSLIRNVKRPLRQYFLPVRPREFHDDHVYVLCLVQMGRESARVFIMGWAHSTDFPPSPCDEEGHPLRGAYVIRAGNLRDMGGLEVYR